MLGGQRPGIHTLLLPYPALVAFLEAKWMVGRHYQIAVEIRLTLVCSHDRIVKHARPGLFGLLLSLRVQ